MEMVKVLSPKRDRRARDARRRRLGNASYTTLVNELVEVIKLAFEAGATATLWGLEGPLRAGIRSDLCLQGWVWETADLMTNDILAEAFRKAGAERPDWDEGQPEWSIPTGLILERTRCVRCHKPLHGEQTKFCGRLCGDSYHNYLAEIRKANEEKALWLSVKSSRGIWTA